VLLSFVFSRASIALSIFVSHLSLVVTACLIPEHCLVLCGKIKSLFQKVKRDVKSWILIAAPNFSEVRVIGSELQKCLTLKIGANR